MEWDRFIAYQRKDAAEKATQIALKQGVQIGVKQGISQGEHNKAVEAAKKLLINNISPQIIAQCTGLSLEEVNTINKE